MKQIISMKAAGVFAVSLALTSLGFVPASGQPQDANWMTEYVRLRVQQKNLVSLPDETRRQAPQGLDQLIAPKIVGGDDAGPDENPFQVALLSASIANNANAQFCGGTLIRANFVLTAAHCSDFITPDDVQVLTGTRRLDGTGTRHDVAEISIHPEWDDTTFDNDVAVWRLANNADGVPLAALAEEDGAVGEDLLATGWGALSQGGTSPIDLQAVEVPLVDTGNCNDANSYNGRITDNMICAGVDAGGIDSCQGDSGGPLTRGLGNALIAGITSWGFGCAQPDLFGVYARVSSPRIREFIEDVVSSGLYQLHRSGAIWRFTGEPCTGTSCPGWERLDNNARTVEIAVGGSSLYQRHATGDIWRYTGTPCAGDSCPGWERLDNNPLTRSIAASGDELYQLHSTGAIWRSTGEACAGDSCPGWVRLDNNPRGTKIATAGGNLYQLHNTGDIWQHTGTPCAGSSCPGWQRLDNNPRSKSIAAVGGELYQLHNSGAIWRYTGTPCSGNSCPGWVQLDNNPRTAEIVAGGGTLYQLHNDGAIWRHTGATCGGSSCPGWQRLDNNVRSSAIEASTEGLYQVHNSGAIWRSTGEACSGGSCPGWQQLDNNPLTSAVAAN